MSAPSREQLEQLGISFKCELCSKDLPRCETVCFQYCNLRLHYICIDCAIAIHEQDNDTWGYCEYMCRDRNIPAEKRARDWREKRIIAFSEPKRENRTKGESK